MLNNNYRDTRPSLSKKSTDSALEQFRQAVERMEQAILVPTRLMDLPLGDPQLRELTGENVRLMMTMQRLVLQRNQSVCISM